MDLQVLMIPMMVALLILLVSIFCAMLEIKAKGYFFLMGAFIMPYGSFMRDVHEQLGSVFFWIGILCLVIWGGLMAVALGSQIRTRASIRTPL